MLDISSSVAVPHWCTIVVPCYNEANRLESNKFLYFLLTHRVPIRFLFVNDGSSDETLPLLLLMRNKQPERISILDLPSNRGKAEAVRIGMLRGQIGSSVIGFWDADLATPLDSIEKLLVHLDSNPAIEMVFGARVRLLGREINRRPLRHYLGRLFATAVSLSLQLPVYDTQCGAKLFRVTPELAEVLAVPFLSRWIFDVEIIARFLTAHPEPAYPHRAIYECPLDSWQDVPGSKVSLFDFLKSSIELLQIRRRYPR